VAVASAGPYASLHLAPDRQPRQHLTTQFLQAACPSCRPTNSVKVLKAYLEYRVVRYSTTAVVVGRNRQLPLAVIQSLVWIVIAFPFVCTTTNTTDALLLINDLFT